jgi:polysaccharide biosynthesis protein PslH
MRCELARTKRYEGQLVSRFDRVLVTSEIDRKALDSLSRSGDTRPDILVLRNGVDLDYFRFDKSISREGSTLVVSGKMSYHANVKMVQYLVNKIMPIVWDRKPAVKLWIVGKDPPKEIRELGNNPAITITGTVSDIRPYLQSATVAVAPITYGAGIQNKILEAMACNTPVVSTPQAVLALEAQPDRDLLIAQDPHTFSEKILFLLDRPDQQREIGSNGRRYVEQHHNWRDVAIQLAGIYSETIEGKRNTAKQNIW